MLQEIMGNGFACGSQSKSVMQVTGCEKMGNAFSQTRQSHSYGAEGARAPRSVEKNAMASSATAREAKVLVAVTFHFKEERLPYFVQTLRALSLWNVTHMQVVLYINDAGEQNIKRVSRLSQEIFGRFKSEVQIVPSLENPWMLTWAHKPLINNVFLNSLENYTHFVYCEDDTILEEANFTYWLSARELLRVNGLLPAFLRLEYDRAQAALTTSDAFWKVFIPAQSYVFIDGIAWVSMPNPYNPLFILDQELAKEYVLSRSFDIGESANIVSWGLAERAAMGLCNEGVPRGFPHRYVVPVDFYNRALNSCQVFHLPSNYANSVSPLGKVRLDELFAGAGELRPFTASNAAPSHPDEAEGSVGTSRGQSVSKASRRGLQAAGAPPAWTEVVKFPVSNTEVDEGFFIVSHHDTVLFYDFEAGVVRHGPFGIAPLNFIVAFKGLNAQFFVLDASGEIRPIAWGGDQFTEGDLFTTDRNFYIDGTHSFSSEGTFLCSLFEGGTRWTIDSCRTWERFRLMKINTIIGLAWLRRENWKSCEGEIVAWRDQPLNFGRLGHSEASALASTIDKESLESRLAFWFGDRRIFLTAIHHKTFILNGTDEFGVPSSLRIVEQDGSYSDFIRDMP